MALPFLTGLKTVTGQTNVTEPVPDSNPIDATIKTGFTGRNSLLNGV